ncbi:MAG: choice-of-anchor R domain-containing protein [Solirubrobacterales bacterium]
MFAAAPARAAVLYDQTTGTPGALLSFGPYEAADDFVVPPGPAWIAQSVDLNGQGVAGHIYTEIWSDAGGQPGTTIYANDNTITTPDNFNAKMLGFLKPGRYWLAVNWVVGNPMSWSWRTQSPQSGNEAVWAGFNATCTYSPGVNWRPLSACGLPGPDLQFRLNGTVASNQFQLDPPRRSPNGGVSIRGTFPNSGDLEVRGRGLKTKHYDVHCTGGNPCRQGMNLGPLPAVKKKLTAGKKIRTTASITFAPSAGYGVPPSTQTVRILLKRKRPSGGRNH